MKISIQVFSASCLFVLAGSAIAQTNYTFTPQGGDTGSWHTPANWSPTGPPDADDSATIPAGKTCNITSADAEIDSITIGNSLSTSGTLYIDGSRTLTIHGDNDATSTIYGVLLFDVTGSTADPRVFLSDTISIAGTGTILAKRFSGNTGSAIIESCPATNCAYMLSIASGIEIAGSVKFDTMNLDSDATMVVDSSLDDMVFGSDPANDNFTTFEGLGVLEVTDGTVTFENAFALTTTLWTVNIDGGVVEIEPEAGMTGSNMLVYLTSGSLLVDSDLSVYLLSISGGTAIFTAELQDGDVEVSGGALIFDDACSPTGQFDISGGTVDVNENVTATDIIWSGGAFTVASGKAISFNP